MGGLYACEEKMLKSLIVPQKQKTCNYFRVVLNILIYINLNGLLMCFFSLLTHL